MNSYSKQNILGVTSGTTLPAASTAVAQAQSIQIMIKNSQGYVICWRVVVVRCSNLTCNWSDQTASAWGQDSSLKFSSLRASLRVRPKYAPEHTQHIQGGWWASLQLRVGLIVPLLFWTAIYSNWRIYILLNWCLLSPNVTFPYHRHRLSETIQPAALSWFGQCLMSFSLLCFPRTNGKIFFIASLALYTCSLQTVEYCLHLSASE